MHAAGQLRCISEITHREMAESITSQLLLAVRAREAFRTETDSVVTARISNVFPGTAQQSLKVTKSLYVKHIF